MKTAFNEVLEEVSKLDTIEAALALALKREMTAQAFYKEKAEAAAEPRLRELYTYLAAEEGKHLSYLEAYRKKLKLPEKEREAEAEKEGKERAERKEKEKTFFSLPETQSFSPEFTAAEPRLGAIAVLIAALRHERKSEYFYTELANLAEEKTLKSFFKKLAGYEQAHYELIDNYLESLTEFRMQT
ncbi:MAG: ferritin family protein [Methanosarcinaceae archaeon]|nr:ferritin family protein [Methanosarcinaceae archaeon]